MQNPLQITIRGIEHSDDLQAHIRSKAEKLDEFFEHVTSCRVVVELPHKHHQQGKQFNVRLDIGVPGSEIVVNHQPSLHGHGVDLKEERHFKGMELEGPYKDFYVAVNDAFKTLRRQLQDYVRRHRNEIKIHPEMPEARVARIFPEGGYGFLETIDGREVYFHRNSVQNDAFDQLDIGAIVEFSEERGEMGPQASHVKIG